MVWARRKGSVGIMEWVEIVVKVLAIFIWGVMFGAGYVIGERIMGRWLIRRQAKKVRGKEWTG